MSKQWVKETKGGTLRYNESTDCLEFVLRLSANAYLPMDDVYALNKMFRVGGNFTRVFKVLRFFEYYEQIKEVTITWLPDQYKLEVSSAMGVIPLDGNFPKYIEELCEQHSGWLDTRLRSLLLSLPMSDVQNCQTNEELVELAERCL